MTTPFYSAPVPIQESYQVPRREPGAQEFVFGPLLMYKKGERKAHCLAQRLTNPDAQTTRWESLPDKTPLDPSEFTHYALAMPNASWDVTPIAQETEQSLLDEDGYPTQWAYHRIAQGPWARMQDVFDFIERIWCFGSMGFFRKEAQDGGVRYWLSTAGWAGNETLIEAMKQNFVLWSTWEQTRKGGHYEFFVDQEANEEPLEGQAA